MNDCVELGGFRGKTGAQAFQFTVRLAQEIRQIVCRDVEGNGGGTHTVLLRRLDQFGGISGLREDDPHRCHGRRARAQVKCEGRVPGAATQRRLACTHRRIVNLPELRGAGEAFAQHVNGASGVVRLKPGNVVANGFVFVVGEEEDVVIRPSDQGLGDWPHADRLGFLRSPKIRVTDPACEDLAHNQRITKFLVLLQIYLLLVDGTPRRFKRVRKTRETRPLVMEAP